MMQNLCRRATHGVASVTIPVEGKDYVGDNAACARGAAMGDGSDAGQGGAHNDPAFSASVISLTAIIERGSSGAACGSEKWTPLFCNTWQLGSSSRPAKWRRYRTARWRVSCLLD